MLELFSDYKSVDSVKDIISNEELSNLFCGTDYKSGFLIDIEVLEQCLDIKNSNSYAKIELEYSSLYSKFAVITTKRVNLIMSILHEISYNNLDISNYIEKYQVVNNLYSLYVNDHNVFLETLKNLQEQVYNLNYSNYRVSTYTVHDSRLNADKVQDDIMNSRDIVIVGTSGSGKTSFLKNLLTEDSLMLATDYIVLVSGGTISVYDCRCKFDFEVKAYLKPITKLSEFSNLVDDIYSSICEQIATFSNISFYLIFDDIEDYLLQSKNVTSFINNVGLSKLDCKYEILGTMCTLTVAQEQSMNPTSIFSNN